MKTKKIRAVPRTNTHKRVHICLTPKQVEELIIALVTAANLATENKGRTYYKKMQQDIQKQLPPDHDEWIEVPVTHKGKRRRKHGSANRAAGRKSKSSGK